MRKNKNPTKEKGKLARWIENQVQIEHTCFDDMMLEEE